MNILCHVCEYIQQLLRMFTAVSFHLNVPDLHVSYCECLLCNYNKYNTKWVKLYCTLCPKNPDCCY